MKLFKKNSAEKNSAEQKSLKKNSADFSIFAELLEVLKEKREIINRIDAITTTYDDINAAREIGGEDL